MQILIIVLWKKHMTLTFWVMGLQTTRIQMAYFGFKKPQLFKKINDFWVHVGSYASKQSKENNNII